VLFDVIGDDYDFVVLCVVVCECYVMFVFGELVLFEGFVVCCCWCLWSKVLV